MTKVKFRIKEIQINLTGWKARKESDLNNTILYKPHTLPCRIAYNKSWIFRFECSACHDIIKFDTTIQGSGTNLDCLFEPYYQKETLKTIASLFENMKVFSNSEEPDKLFLTHQDYNDINAVTLLITTIRLHHNSCPNCNTLILYWISDEPPRTPRREYPNGGSGYLRIEELIGIEVGNNRNFIDV